MSDKAHKPYVPDDAKLPEFHGRIRRDGWVTQARALHQSKYGEPPSARG